MNKFSSTKKTKSKFFVIITIIYRVKFISSYLIIFHKNTWIILLNSHYHNIDLKTSMNERTHFFIKIYLSHFILEKVDVSVVCERWVERHILRERTSSSHIFFRVPGGTNACTPLHARQRRL